MNKKGYDVIIDSEEDSKIKDVAGFNKKTNSIFLVVLILLLVSNVITTLVFGYIYFNNFDNDNKERLTIANKDSYVVVLNDSNINFKLSSSDLELGTDKIYTNVDSISLTNKTKDTDVSYEYSVIYNISKNEFLKRNISGAYEDLYVAFSYSYDNENWNYINSSLTTSDSQINTVYGYYYNISGLETLIKVNTNDDIIAEKGESKTIYWRAETMIKPNDNTYDERSFTASFEIINNE